LVFGDTFDQSLACLPKSLTELTFGYVFNSYINFRKIPLLTKLTFGDFFNRKFEINTLPNSLTDLRLGARFQRTILANELPSRLNHLKLGHGLQLVREVSLPLSLSRLTLYFPHLNRDFVTICISAEDHMFLSTQQRFDTTLQDIFLAQARQITRDQHLRQLRQFQKTGRT
jgi:hypothetical protein